MSLRETVDLFGNVHAERLATGDGTRRLDGRGTDLLPRRPVAVCAPPAREPRDDSRSEQDGEQGPSGEGLERAIRSEEPGGIATKPSSG